MSKSLGNVIYPQDMIDKYGADILRLWVSASDYREDIRISPEIIKGLVDAYRKIRNTLRYLLGNTSDFTPSKTLPFDQLRPLDKFALARLQEVVKEVTTAYETYEFHRAATAINQFCAVDLSGFYLDILKDTLYCDALSSENRRSAQAVLWEICTVIPRLLAPILSYTAEEVWQEIRKKDPSCPESVFLAEYPVPQDAYSLSKDARAMWDALFAVREKALASYEGLRKEKKIGSNLDARVEIKTADPLILNNREMLPFVLGTWDVTASPGGKETDVSVSSYPKCERCWRHLEDVSTAHPHGGTLCSRCSAVLEGKA